MAGLHVLITTYLQGLETFADTPLQTMVIISLPLVENYSKNSILETIGILLKSTTFIFPSLYIALIYLFYVLNLV
jgi:hypothetical protein